MTSGANDEWVRQGTPHDDNADWNEEQSEYGTAISPTEWDDYSSEQSVPVAPPRARSGDGAATAGSPGSPVEAEPTPPPGQEPDADEEYRSDEIDPATQDEPSGDADEDGLEPARIDDPMPAEDTVIDAPLTDEHDDEMTRPRPIVPDAATSADGTTGLDDSTSSEERHVEAAEYLAVDPVPVDQVDDQPTDGDEADGEPTQYVAADDEPTQYVGGEHVGDETRRYDALDDEPTQHVGDETTRYDALDDEPTQHVGDETAHYDAFNDESSQHLDDDATRSIETDDMEATPAAQVAAVGAAGGATAATAASQGTVPDGLYRSTGTEETAVIAQDEYPNTDADVEEERRQAQLEAERQAREQRLGSVPTSTENERREDVGPARIATDRFLPSFGLFVLRIVVAGVLGLASFQILGSGVDATANHLAGYPLIPEPRLVAWILGFTLGAMALLLVIGLLQRLVGLLLLVISVASLVFIRWGNFPIFSSGGLWVDGFIGDKDLLLATVGLLLLSLGGGAWGIDGAFRRARAASKADRLG